MLHGFILPVPDASGAISESATPHSVSPAAVALPIACSAYCGRLLVQLSVEAVDARTTSSTIWQWPR